MLNFNSKEYTYCDMQVFVLGRFIGGARGIEYKKKKAKEALFGAGRNPRSIQHGKREVEGTLTLLQSEVTALNVSAKAAGHQDILDVDFDIVISFMSPTGILTVDRVIQASISESPKAMKEGDMFMEIALPFIALAIEESI